MFGRSRVFCLWVLKATRNTHYCFCRCLMNRQVVLSRLILLSTGKDISLRKIPLTTPKLDDYSFVEVRCKEFFFFFFLFVLRLVTDIILG